jgi:hypothetical protein
VTAGGDHPARALLAATLEVAVPLCMLTLAQLPADRRETVRLAWAADAVEPVASRGDALMYGGKKGAAADVFNHLARGLAALAYQPGGVDFAGLHFEADPQPDLERRRVDGTLRTVVDALKSL